MKKIKLVLGAFLTLFIVACEGPEGPPGLDGLDALSPTVFEQSVDFTYFAEDNLWASDLLTFDGDIVDGDIFLVFISFDGNLFTPLPASIFDEFGEFQYIFDHDVDSVELQIIGDNDLSGLDAASTQNILTRVAIIPAEFALEFGTNNLTSINQIMSLGGLSTSDIKTLGN